MGRVTEFILQELYRQVVGAVGLRPQATPEYFGEFLGQLYGLQSRLGEIYRLGSEDQETLVNILQAIQSQRYAHDELARDIAKLQGFARSWTPAVDSLASKLDETQLEIRGYGSRLEELNNKVEALQTWGIEEIGGVQEALKALQQPAPRIHPYVDAGFPLVPGLLKVGFRYDPTLPSIWDRIQLIPG